MQTKKDFIIFSWCAAECFESYFSQIDSLCSATKFVPRNFLLLFANNIISWCRSEYNVTATEKEWNAHHTSKLSYRRFPSYLHSVDSSLIFRFHLLPSPVHHSGFSFCVSSLASFPFILLSLKNKNTLAHNLSVRRFHPEIEQQEHIIQLVRNIFCNW